jgi:hypothetical protein
LGRIAYQKQKEIRDNFYKELFKKVECASQNEIEFLESIFNELEYFVDIRINNGGNNE